MKKLVSVLTALVSCITILSMCFSTVSAGVTNSNFINLQEVRYAVVLNNPNGGLLGSGHQAIILVDNYGNGELFSFGPANDDWSKKAWSPGRIDYGLYSRNELNGVLKSHSFLSFRLTNNNKTQHSQWYTLPQRYENYNYIVIPVTSNEGNRMLAKAKEYINNIPQYKLFSFQCDNFVSSIMGAGGKDFWVGNIPNISFDNISKSWGYGIYSSSYWQAPILSSSISTSAYVVTANGGVKIRTGAGTGYSQVGGVSKGSVIRYTESRSANGYTWIKIASGSSFNSGTWGNTTGNWVAMVGGSTSSSASVSPSTNSYTVTATSGVKIRTGAGTGYSQVGGVSKGSVIRYTESRSANGYTWIKIASGSSFNSGTWGNTTGNWIAMVG
ncbi:MAG: SH3 domain-containing protein [Oscillospiraceae bacterium]|jgi:uncharacterized protein YraI|nr:SH3 domain-containing protein [Oscillospiraceae bacterium]